MRCGRVGRIGSRFLSTSAEAQPSTPQGRDVVVLLTLGTSYDRHRAVGVRRAGAAHRVHQQVSERVATFRADHQQINERARRNEPLGGCLVFVRNSTRVARDR